MFLLLVISIIINSTVQLKVAEEQTADPELSHIAEVINYFAFADDGNLTVA